MSADYLARELAEQGRTTPLPPWGRHPDIERLPFGWQEGRLDAWATAGAT